MPSLRKQHRLLLDSILLGIAGGLAARGFVWLLGRFNDLFLVRLAGYTAPSPAGEGGVITQIIGPHGLWWIPLATTLGGLVVGLLVFSLAPEAEGHGTDTAVKAYHQAGGFIRARVPLLKVLASAITIGSGGSAGREGPTALISAGMGSVYGTLTRRSDEDRRTLLLIGMAAGLSAIFRSPIGTAFFAVEVLYSTMEFDAWVLLYTMLGSIVAYTVNGLFVGWQPLFHVPPVMDAMDNTGYLWLAFLGIAAGLAGVLLPEVFYRLRDAFKALPIRPHLKPAVGGLGVGLMALVLPQVLGGGYGWIQLAIEGKLLLSLMAILIFAKMVAMALTVSSGGSGGVFAPSLFVGAMLGGTVAKVFHQPAAVFVIVGMAAVFAGAARVPIATLLMVTEMTGGYQLLVPAALAITVSWVVQKQFSTGGKYPTLYESQVEGRPDSPAHHIKHLESTIALFTKQKVVLPEAVTHLHLDRLLETGIPVDLPGHRRLLLKDLQDDSPLVGAEARHRFPTERQEECDLVAVFREGNLIFPKEAFSFQPGDRLLLIASSEPSKQAPFFGS